MPVMPPKPCKAPRCRVMASKGGYCDEHKPVIVPWQSSIGKSAKERGYGSSWVKLRKSALKRDYYLCQECKKSGIATPATEVDHILNKARGGDDDMNNLQSLCKPCHKRKTIEERSQ